MEVSHFMLSKKVSGMLAGNAIRIFCDNVTCFETKKAPGRLPLHSDCVENTEARFALVRWLIRSTQIWNHRSTSIVLTNSRLPSPCVATAVLTHPRGTCTRRNFSRQNGCHRDGDIEGRYTNDGIYSNEWVIVRSSHVQVAWGAFSKTIHRMTVCLKFFEEHQIFRNTPRVKSIGYSTMAVFYTLFSIVLTFMNL